MGFFSSIIDFFSSDDKKLKTKNKRTYTHNTSKQYKQTHNYKSYTSNKKQNFNKELKKFKEKERKRIMQKYDVCSDIFYPSTFRASYHFVQEYPDIQQIDLALENIDTAMKEIKTMEKWYAQQKKSR